MTGWKVELSPNAAKWLRKADCQVARHLRDALRFVEGLDDPRSRGKALSGTLAGLWRYRVGDYRVICDLVDSSLVVLVIEISHRSDAYSA